MRTIPILFLAVVVAGCSGLIVKKDMGSAIDANAKLTAATQPSDAVANLTTKATIFQSYYTGATVNGLAWLFDPTKSIYCTPAYYVEFGKMATWSAAATSRPAIAVSSDATETAWLVQVKNAKDGVAK